MFKRPMPSTDVISTSDNGWALVITNKDQRSIVFKVTKSPFLTDLSSLDTSGINIDHNRDETTTTISLTISEVPAKAQQQVLQMARIFGKLNEENSCTGFHLNRIYYFNQSMDRFVNSTLKLSPERQTGPRREAGEADRDAHYAF